MNDLRLNSVVSQQATSGGVRAKPASNERPVAAENAAVDTSIRAEINKTEVAQSTKALPDVRQLKKMAEEMQRRVGGADSQIQFTVDESTGISVVKVTDRATKEVIRQIPSEEMLEIAKGLDRYKEGLLLNSQA